MTAVSIVMPCFNAEAFIADALTSVQKQTLPDWECLVVDDCSTDGSAAVLRQFAEADSRIVPIFLSKNGGVSAARNAALDAATGRWITLLDADDLYAPDRLRRLVALAEDQQADMVFDDQAIADFPNAEQVDRAFHWLSEPIMPFCAERFFVESSYFGRSLNPGYMKPLFARRFIESHHLRYDLNFRSGQDYLFYANAFAADPRCFGTDFAGYIYRRRVGSLSRSGGQHLRNHARLSDEILARHGSRLPPTVHEALRRRRRHFLRAADLHDLRVALAARDWRSAAKVTLTRPQLAFAAAAAARRRFGSSRAGG